METRRWQKSINEGETKATKKDKKGIQNATQKKATEKLQKEKGIRKCDKKRWRKDGNKAKNKSGITKICHKNAL